MKTPSPLMSLHHQSANPRPLSNVRRVRNQFILSRTAARALLVTLSALWAAPVAHAQSLTWDTVSGDGAAITAGSGTWDLATANWNDGVGNVLWTQNPTTNSAIFAGTDGAVDSYAVTLGTTVATSNLTFNSSGYLITGSPLAITNGAANGPITVAAGKTATINSTIRYNHNVATPVTVNAGSVLNLGGGTTANFNPQWNFSGAGTVNFTAGTFTSNIGNVNTATNNLTGGTYNYTPGNGAGATIGNNVSQAVSYTVSGTGTLTCNNNASSGTGTGLSYLGLGFSNGVNKVNLTVKTGGTVSIGNGKYGELQIARNGECTSQFDVQGGTVTIANGTTANKIYLFKAGANASRTASMTQSPAHPPRCS